MKQLRFKVISTEGHKEFFTSRKKAEAYIDQLYKEGKVGEFIEFRIFEIEGE